MSFMMGQQAQSKQRPQVSGLQVQTSTYGAVLAIVFGKTRIAPNLLWYGDFQAIFHEIKAGKGGAAGGGGGKGGGGGGSYTYKTALAMAFCEGPITEVGKIWNSKALTDVASLGFSVFKGTYPQDAWGYLVTNHPNEALGYPGICYLAHPAFDLGDSPQLPLINAEITGFFPNAVPGLPDADPKDVVRELLTNANYGINYPAAYVEPLTDYSAYCRATGMVISPGLTEQTAASDLLSQIAEHTNSEIVCDPDGTFDIVPYGDEAITANGASYSPPDQPLYDLTDDDFMPRDGEDPVNVTRSRATDAFNSVSLEYLNRANDYNPEPCNRRDQASIDLYGKRPEDMQTVHFFADPDAVATSAQLRLQRLQANRNIYQFKLGWKYSRLKPMQIVTLTDSVVGLKRQWVRLKGFEENDDGSLDFTAEEFLNGNGNAAKYPAAVGTRYSQDYNAPAGEVEEPLIFEPTLVMTGGTFEVWCAVAGASTNWGGCEIWVSETGDTYRLADTIRGPARYGVLANSLANSAPGIDQTHTLSVDLSLSKAELLAGTSQDAISVNTPCWVDGEVIAYANADLTGANQYDLTYLNRGCLGTKPASHAGATPFARLDDAIARIPFDGTNVGSTIQIKFVSMNQFGAGKQDISQVQPYSYKITGIALASPLPNPSAPTVNYVGKILHVRWTGIDDLRRPIDYEVRRGPSFANSQVILRTPLLDIAAPGDGTYWIAAHYVTPDGTHIYSADPVSIEVTGSSLVDNVVATYDEAATGWTGTCDSGCEVVGDFVHLKAGELAGIYEIPAEHVIEVATLQTCSVSMTWLLTGQSVDDDILAADDILSLPDILGAQYSTFVSSQPQIAISADGSTFGDWQNFSPGAYTFKAIKARMLLMSTNGAVIAVLQEWSVTVDVDDRLDQGTLTTSDSGLTTKTYDTPFNGGASGQDYPLPQVTILDAEEGDDLVLTSVDLSGFQYGVKNGGSFVARTLFYASQGY